jgi:adenylate kinase
LKGLVIVVGLPGVGKSTVLEELEKEASRRGLKIQIVNYGTVMMGLAEESGRQVSHRDEMRKRSAAFQRELQAEAARRIAGMAEAFDGITLVDTHMIVRAGSGYLPGLPSHVLSLLKPNLIALIEAPPSNILARRLKDAEVRERETPIAEEVNFEIQLSRVMAAACSTLTGAPLTIVENLEGKAGEAAAKLLEAVKGVEG